MRRLFPLLLASAFLLTGPVLAQSDDPLSMDDLGSTTDIDPATEKKLRAHLKQARRFMDKKQWAKARAELDAADALVPMHDDVLELSDQLGGLADEERKAARVLADIEREQADLEEQKELEGRKVQKRQDAVGRVMEKHALPRKLKLAVLRMHERIADIERRMGQANLARDKCIAAAALAHAAAGAARCKDISNDSSAARKDLKDAQADLVVLESAYRDRHGEKALERLLKQAKK